jgi:hypothetical protein
MKARQQNEHTGYVRASGRTPRLVGTAFRSGGIPQASLGLPPAEALTETSKLKTGIADTSRLPRRSSATIEGVWV